MFPNGWEGNIIRKNDPELSFEDAPLSLIEREWKSQWLNKLLGLVDWKPFNNQFKKLYADDTGRRVSEMITAGLGKAKRDGVKL